MVASDDRGYDVPALKGNPTGGGLYVHVADVKPLFERAVTAGATVVFGPEQTE